MCVAYKKSDLVTFLQFRQLKRIEIMFDIFLFYNVQYCQTSAYTASLITRGIKLINTGILFYCTKGKIAKSFSHSSVKVKPPRQFAIL